MSDWKENIEAQIAYLTTMLGVQSQQRSKPSMMLADSIESLKLLLDVAVAADDIRTLLDAAIATNDIPYVDAVAWDEIWDKMKQALDKLREASDE